LVIVASGLISRPLLAIPENDGGSGNHCIRLPFFDAVEGQISFWGLLLDNYEFRYVFPEEFRVMLTDIHHSAILPFRHFHSHSILRFRPSTPRFIAIALWWGRSASSGRGSGSKAKQSSKGADAISIPFRFHIGLVNLISAKFFRSGIALLQPGNQSESVEVPMS
jgi:hypothetical protein